MMTIEEAIKHCEEKGRGCTECAAEHRQLSNWLKELKNLKRKQTQSSWKPSKGQMKALNTCIMQGEISYVGQGTELQSLYNDLKKLTE